MEDSTLNFQPNGKETGNPFSQHVAGFRDRFSGRSAVDAFALLPKMSSHLAWALTLILVWAGSTTAIAETIRYPAGDDDLESIHDSARHISLRSVPSCSVAACVDGDCQEYQAVLARLREATVFVNALIPELARVRDLTINNIHSVLNNSTMSQNLIYQGQYALDVQKFFYQIADIIDSVLSMESFVRDFADKKDKWWGFWSSNENRIKQIDALIDHLLDIVGKLDSAVRLIEKATGTTPSEAQTQARYISAVYNATVKTLRDIRRIMDELKIIRTQIVPPNIKGLLPADVRARQLKIKAGANLIAQMVLRFGKLYVQSEMRELAGRIADSEDSLAAENDRIETDLAFMKRTARRRESAIETRNALDEAERFMRFCVVRVCGAGTAPEAVVSSDIPGVGFEARIQFIQNRLDALEGPLLQGALAYRPVGDFNSGFLTATNQSYRQFERIELEYEARACIPDDARISVFRKSDLGAIEIWQAAIGVPPSGTVSFFARENLEGIWLSESDSIYRISGVGPSLTLERPNTPIEGRIRTYRRRSEVHTQESETGEYEARMVSKTKLLAIPPIKFRVTGNETRPPVNLSYSITSVDDLKPGLPENVRRSLVDIGLQFGATASFSRNLYDELEIDVEFRNHSLRWDRETGEVDRESIVEKIQSNVRLHREE